MASAAYTGSIPRASASSGENPLVAALAHLAATITPRSSGTSPPSAQTNGSFWSNYTVGGGLPANYSSLYCDQYYPGYFCFPQAAYPSVLPLPDGNVGYAYESFTNATTSTCPFALNNTTEVRVEFQLSSDGGRSFSAPVDLGNTTCPYYQAMEPSFTVGTGGAIYGAFVEANATPAMLNCYPGCGPFWGQGLFYTDRVSDALAFLKSSDEGASFGRVTTVSTAGLGNISDPSIASYGSTVYIAYMNINNTTTGATLGGSQAPPISAQLVYSSNGGSTWHGPYLLPGFNATEYYNAMNPQVTVGPGGVVYVAYSSDRHCIAYCSYTSQEYGDDIFLASSTSNGTSWSAHLVAKDTGNAEDLSQAPDGLSFSNGATSGPYIFEEGPQVVLAVAPSTGDIYVAWTGSVNESDHYYCGPPAFPFSYGCIYDSYAVSVMHVATSTNGGISWTNTTAGPAQNYYQQGQPNGEFMPGISVSPGGTVYLSYATYNGTYVLNGCYQEGSYGDLGFEGQWVTTSTTGSGWTSPNLLAWNYNGQGGWWNLGGTTSVAFNLTTGSPLIGYALSSPTTNLPFGPYQEYTWPGVVQLAKPYSGSTTTLTLHEHGLPGGTPWKAWVMGNLFNTTAINLTIDNAPTATPLWVKTGLPPTYVGYGAAYLPNLTLPVSNYGYAFQGGQQFLNLSAPALFDFNFSLFYFLNISLQPLSLENGGVSFEIFDPANNFGDWGFWANGAFGGGCNVPWLVPAGWQLHITGYQTVGPLPGNELFYNDNNEGAIGYFNGTGSGSYTGVGPNGTITMNGPVNETGWIGTFGVYNITVGAPTLPAGTPTHFDWAGDPYSFAAPGPATVHNVSTGIYPISDIWGASSSPGYEYFGTSDAGDPVAVPNHPNVNLSFAYVDVGAPVGTVSFEASGLTVGTPWQLEFNGTTYVSSTPWINVSSRPGTYATAGFPVVAANGSESYYPLSLSANLTVTTGATYLVNFSRVVQVTIAPSQGGTVSPAGSTYWLAPGTPDSFTATARPGYSFAGWQGKGAGSYTGSSPTADIVADGPITETPIFDPVPANHYALTFDAGSLPHGTEWSVYVDGTGYSTTAATLTVPDLYSCSAGPAGNYTIQIPYAYVNGSQDERFTPGLYPAWACGGAPTIDAGFSAQYLLSVTNTSGGTATAEPVTAFQPSSGSLWVLSGESTLLRATPNVGFSFLGWTGTGPGSYTGPNATAQITIDGAINEVAAFGITPASSPPQYSVTFRTVAAPPAGLVWGIVLGGTTYESGSNEIIVPGLAPGTYALHVPVSQAPDGETQWSAVAPPSQVVVASNSSVTLSFLASYWVSVQAVGSGTVSPASGWVPYGTSLTFSATPVGASTFEGWAGTGNGSYTGPGLTGSATVRGSIQEVATFVPSSLTGTSSPSDVWGSPAALVGLAVVGLAVGAVVGWALFRRRGSPPATPSSSMAEAEVAPTEAAPMEGDP